MSTLPELNELLTSEDEDLLLIRDVSLLEDKKITKVNLLKETEQNIQDVNDRVDSVEAGLDKVYELTSLAATEELVFNSKISTTQANPFPLANSLPVDGVIYITVLDEDKGITTTHLPSGSDTTSGLSGDGYVINWNSGGVVKFVTNGLDKWSKV